jgi:hypothetical protein
MEGSEMGGECGERERAKSKCDREGLLGSCKGMGEKFNLNSIPHRGKNSWTGTGEIYFRSGQGMFRNRKQMTRIIVKIKKMYCWNLIWRIFFFM